MARERAQAEERALRLRRFLVLMEQLLEEEGDNVSQVVERRLHGAIHETYVHKARERAEKPPGKHSITLDKIRSICAALGLREAYFTDPSLGEAPDYHDHLERESHVEPLEDEGYPEVERYIADMQASGEPISEEHQHELRGIRSSGGPDAITWEVVRGAHRGMIARDARRAIDAPIIEAEIEVERGQRPLRRKR